MSPDWWQICEDLAERDHCPSDFEGRDWQALTSEERDKAITMQATRFVAYLRETGRAR